MRSRRIAVVVVLLGVLVGLFVQYGYKRTRQLRQVGVDPDLYTVELHNARESPKHLTMKALLALHIQQRGRPWGTEIDVNGGTVDVLDFGAPDGAAVVYEIETDCTPEREQQKVEQYTSFAIRDVLVLDPTDAPDSLPALWDWLDAWVLG